MSGPPPPGETTGLYHTADRLSYASGAGDGVAQSLGGEDSCRRRTFLPKNPAQNGTAGLSIFRAIAYK